jgi:hypothetical protein
MKVLQPIGSLFNLFTHLRNGPVLDFRLGWRSAFQGVNFKGTPVSTDLGDCSDTDCLGLFAPLIKEQRRSGSNYLHVRQKELLLVDP